MFLRIYPFSAKASGFLPESFEERRAFQSFFVILRASFLFRGSAGEQDTEILGEEAVLLPLVYCPVHTYLTFVCSGGEAVQLCLTEGERCEPSDSASLMKELRISPIQGVDFGVSLHLSCGT